VVEGQLNGQGVFAADVMMTKCASKYESSGQAPMDKANAS
jgi:cytochrome c-type biogenesis protein CcmE